MNKNPAWTRGPQDWMTFIRKKIFKNVSEHTSEIIIQKTSNYKYNVIF